MADQGPRRKEKRKRTRTIHRGPAIHNFTIETAIEAHILRFLREHGHHHLADKCKNTFSTAAFDRSQRLNYRLEDLINTQLMSVSVAPKRGAVTLITAGTPLQRAPTGRKQRDELSPQAKHHAVQDRQRGSNTVALSATQSASPRTAEHVNSIATARIADSDDSFLLEDATWSMPVQSIPSSIARQDSSDESSSGSAHRIDSHVGDSRSIPTQPAPEDHFSDVLSGSTHRTDEPAGDSGSIPTQPAPEEASSDDASAGSIRPLEQRTDDVPSIPTQPAHEEGPILYDSDLSD